MKNNGKIITTLEEFKENLNISFCVYARYAKG